MIKIDRLNLVSGNSYFIERIPHYENTNSKFKGIFINNQFFYNVINTYFENVSYAKKNSVSIKGPSIFVDSAANLYIWEFYQDSKPIFLQRALERMYNKAIDQELCNITRDPDFFKYFLQFE